MGIFGDIMSKIFGQSAKAETPAARHRGSFSLNSAESLASSVRHHDPRRACIRRAPRLSGRRSLVDVKAVLLGLAKSKKQKLNYDKSIVDLLKLLDLDSSLTARQELAKELGYSGTHKGLIENECLAPQGGHAPARRQWWKSSEDMDGVERHSRTEFCLTQWPAEFPELIALRPRGRRLRPAP